jgi:hypothetical protein
MTALRNVELPLMYAGASRAEQHEAPEPWRRQPTGSAYRPAAS